MIWTLNDIPDSDKLRINLDLYTASFSGISAIDIENDGQTTLFYRSGRRQSAKLNIDTESNLAEVAQSTLIMRVQALDVNYGPPDVDRGVKL